MDPSSIADQLEQDGLLSSQPDDAPGRPIVGVRGLPKNVLRLWELSLAAGHTAETRRLVVLAHKIQAAKAVSGGGNIG